MLPNLKGKAVVAPDGVTFAGRGTVVGAETVALTTAQLAAHAHAVGTLAISPNPHDHTYNDQTFAAFAAAGAAVNTVNTLPTSNTGTTSLSITGAAATEGGGTAHTNIQPTRVCGAVWIKR